MSTPDKHQENTVVRRRFINPPPSADDEVLATSVDAAKREFAKRLQEFMTNKGWNQSDLARAAAKFMPDKKFNRDNVSLYVRAQQLPGRVRLRAMAKALGVEETKLIPLGATASVDEDVDPPLAIRPLGGGNVWLQVNRAIEQEIAWEIAALLGKSKLDKK